MSIYDKTIAGSLVVLADADCVKCHGFGTREQRDEEVSGIFTNLSFREVQCECTSVELLRNVYEQPKPRKLVAVSR